MTKDLDSGVDLESSVRIADSGSPPVRISGIRHCCVCGSRLNSYNTTDMCSPCRRALPLDNRLSSATEIHRLLKQPYTANRSRKKFR